MKRWGKKAEKNSPKNFWAFFPRGKKGIEMEQLILIVLALVLLFFILAWSGTLGKELGDLFNKLVDWF